MKPCEARLPMAGFPVPLTDPVVKTISIIN